MRALKVSLVAAVAGVSMFASGCSVIADETAASVDGVKISMDDVDRVARDPLFNLVSDKDAPKFKLPGDAARSALMFEITRAAWVAEAKRWGLDLESARPQAEQQLEQQISSSGQQIDLSDEMREAYIESFAARMVIEDRFSKLDPENDKDLRKVYELSDGLWDRTCAWILVVPPGAEAKVMRLASDGASFEKVADKVEGASLVADPEQSCLSRSSIPVEIRDDIQDLALDTNKMIELESQGTVQPYLVRVESRSTVKFAKAIDEVRQITEALAQEGSAAAWIQTRVADVQIDPRFASAVSFDAQGQPMLLPPPTPLPADDATEPVVSSPDSSTP